MDRLPPDEAPPVDLAPAVAERPPVVFEPPDELVPPLDSAPPVVELVLVLALVSVPPVGAEPPRETEPPTETEPPEARVPPKARVPPDPSDPPVAEELPPVAVGAVPPVGAVLCVVCAVLEVPPGRVFEEDVPPLPTGVPPAPDASRPVLVSVPLLQAAPDRASTRTRGARAIQLVWRGRRSAFDSVGSGASTIDDSFRDAIACARAHPRRARHPKENAKR